MKASKVLFLVFLIMMSLCVVSTRSVMAQSSGTIYIRSDGSVEPVTAPIQRDGNVYTLTSNVVGNMVVQKDNIVIDGALYSLQGNETGTGIYVKARSNVTIRNVAVTNFHIGINLENTMQSKLTNNDIKTYTYEDGIKLTSSAYNIVSDNVIYSYADLYSPPNRGITLENCSENTISENRITGSFYGVYLHRSNSNTLSGNSITESEFGIDLYWSSYNNLAWNTIFSTVLVISRGVFTDSGTGIWLEVNSTYNRVHKNNVKNNGEAMRVWDFSSNNIIYENNFINNTNQISIITRGIPNPQSIPIPNSWDNGTVGNYWSDYLTKYPNATEIDGSGIWNTPYFINENNIDNFPLMAYWCPPTISILSPENKTYTVNNVSLAFSVSEPTSWIGYSLDGQANVTIPGNTTLSGLSDGSHSLTVYARGPTGKIGASETIYFTIAQQSESFPTTWILAAIAIVAMGIVITLGVAIYRRKRLTSNKTPN